MLVAVLAVSTAPNTARADVRRAARGGPTAWFAAPRDLAFALPFAVSQPGAKPSLRAHDDPTPAFVGMRFAALDFWGAPVGVARGAQLDATPRGTWSPWGFEPVSGSMGARLFVDQSIAQTLRPRVAEAFAPNATQRALLAKTLRQSTRAVFLALRTADHARYAIAGGSTLRVFQLQEGTWRARGAIRAKDVGAGDSLVVTAVLDMDGDDRPEIVTELWRSDLPDAEPETFALRWRPRARRLEVVAHFVDSGP